MFSAMPGLWNSHYSSNNSLGGAINWWQQQRRWRLRLTWKKCNEVEGANAIKTVRLSPFYHTTLLCSTTFLSKNVTCRFFGHVIFMRFILFTMFLFLFLLSDMRWNTYQVHRHIKTAAIKDKFHLIYEEFLFKMLNWQYFFSEVPTNK